MLPLPASVGLHCASGAGGLAVTALQCFNLMSAFSEASSPTPYSKFAEEAGTSPSAAVIGGRAGMLVIYAPALAASAFFAANSPSVNGREALCASLLAAHFGKRVLETLFLHIYSGSVSAALSGMIGAFYALVASLIVFTQRAVPAELYAGATPSVGLACFAVGLAGNLYHHQLLASQRSASKARYVVPTGGLFDYCTMPHYLFEVLGWIGIALVAQQLNAFLVSLGMASYLGGRAVSTTKWYVQKFGPDYPASRRHIVPFVF
ncbi:3-oxo-5-alpha-steroid 4-dehydrogenase-domain-containing protein [Pelagophyceae sp. CCMP2097]|nr:3-oxo-5-alpha-steroid 4-dehydrogenase-domain-containing protein [Pelagophyceae sp. CCMP2097]